GALQTTTDILQRIRTLAVEGSSDIVSDADRANLQAEVGQLVLEVNRISQNTSFNGQALLDGSHAGFQQQVDSTATITANADVATPSATGSTQQLVSNVSINPTATTGQGQVDGTVEVQVAQLTSTSQGIIVTFYSSANGNTTAPTQQIINNASVSAGGAQVFVDNITLTFSAVGTLDVGVTSFVKVSQYVAAASNPNAPAFNFQSGADEGDTIQVGIQSTSTNTLRIANINLVGPPGFGSLASEDSIGQIDNALQSLLSQRAALGAVIVRLNEDQTNDNNAAVNLQASESAIRDLNVGSETTEYTKLQVLVQVGTSVLAQANQNAQSVLGLFR
ncbi:MAG: hypothetical protein JO199_11990, partial [Candidatus Eremiobacteraeota bacterium]|nr:hypothetical protein [Candidatus Eremiobacteraeota bacterium]